MIGSRTLARYELGRLRLPVASCPSSPTSSTCPPTCCSALPARTRGNPPTYAQLETTPIGIVIENGLSPLLEPWGNGFRFPGFGIENTDTVVANAELVAEDVLREV